MTPDNRFNHANPDEDEPTQPVDDEGGSVPDKPTIR